MTTAAHHPATPIDVRRGLTDPADTAFPLRWGILGTGNISSMWVQSTRAVAGATITAVAAREIERAESFATNHAIDAAYGDYAAMCAADNVDIVYVGTITQRHKEHTLLALEAGKHVLCEKALAVDATEARDMYAAAERHGVMLQDAMWTRFFPAVEHARYLIETGAIGDVKLVQSDFFDPIYTIQAGPLAFGADAQVQKVTATGRRSGAAIIEYAEDRLAVFTFPPGPAELAEVTEIVGTHGRITLEQPGHCPTQITVRIPPADGVPSRYRTAGVPAPAQRFEYPLPADVAIAKPFPNQQGFRYQADAVHRCIAAGILRCPQYDEAESLHAMDLLTAISHARSNSE